MYFQDIEGIKNKNKKIFSIFKMEYSGPTVGANGCAYATLNSYNQNYFGRGGVGAPVLSQTRSAEVVVIPSYGAQGYNNMSSKKPSCSGYMNLRSSYPNYPNACGAFSSRMCG